MFPPWLLGTFYVVSAVTIVWLLLRLWRKNRQADRAADSFSSPPPLNTPQPDSTPELTATTASAAAATTASPSTSTATAAPLPPVETLSILKSSGATAPRSSSSVPADEADLPPWQQRPLFGDRQERRDQPERVLAEDTPVARTDDLVFGPLTPAMAALFPDAPRRREETRRELLAAGYYQPHALQNLSAVRYAAMMGGLVLGLVWLVLAPPRWEWLAVSSVVAFPLLGWALPRLYVRSRAAERRSEIERAMPDLLDMLNMCVSQGLTVPEALRRILRDLRSAYPALAQELRIVLEQAGIGNMQVALENFSRRIDLPEVHSFTSLLTQTERMGTSLSDALTAYSDSMRESLRQRADEKGNRATFQLLFPTVLCLMPAVYLFLLGPAIIDLSEFFSAGGRDALDRGTQVIQRLNADRRALLPNDLPSP